MPAHNSSPAPPLPTRPPAAAAAASSSSSQSSPSAEDDYFSTHAAPAGLSATSARVASFIRTHNAAARRVVLISSGGTTVPLENQTVRFIDNFSAGTRGATSAEYFLQSGYAVIFLHRQFSLLPYSRHYSHSTNCFLDFLTEWGRIGDGDDDDDGGGKGGGGGGKGGEVEGEVVVRKKYRREMLDVLRRYRDAKERDTLLLIPFTTVTSYLFLLREIATQMQPLAHRGLFYLAAAVSDFFVPPDRMAEHKIQSGDILGGAGGASGGTGAGTGGSGGGGTLTNATEPFVQPAATAAGKKLVIDLDPVPKFLKPLADRWAPDATIVSFKLETDPALLLAKCNTALDRYQHSLVIGNLLSTRKWEVVFVDHHGQHWIRLPGAGGSGGGDGGSGGGDGGSGDGAGAGGSGGGGGGGGGGVEDTDIEIESLIVPEVVRRHEAVMALGMANHLPQEEEKGKRRKIEAERKSPEVSSQERVVGQKRAWAPA